MEEQNSWLINKTWNSIRRDSCKRVSSCVNKVGNALGASDISNMWQTQFSQLYNSLDTSRTKREFLNRVSDGVEFEQRSITVNEVSVALRHQKKDKSAGPNGIFMESLIYADNRLHVHLSLLFTFCLRHCYLPKACMDSVLMPLVKNKGGDLTDVDNYRRLHSRMLKQRC